MRGLIVAAALAFAAPVWAQEGRPEAPGAVEASTVYAPGLCEQAGTRAVVLASFQQDIEQRMQQARAYNEYGGAFAAWKSERMVARGIWSDDEASSFAAALLGDPEFTGFFDRSMAGMTAFLEAGAAYGEAQEAGDETAACVAAVSAVQAMNGAMDSTLAQWRYMFDRYDAETRRRGAEPE